jgi:hypothetical protein
VQWVALDALGASGQDAEMNNIYDVVKKKEFELAQVQKQLEILRFAARVLSEGTNDVEQTSRTAVLSAGSEAVPGQNTASAREALPVRAAMGLRQYS